MWDIQVVLEASRSHLTASPGGKVRQGCSNHVQRATGSTLASLRAIFGVWMMRFRFHGSTMIGAVRTLKVFSTGTALTTVKAIEVRCRTKTYVSGCIENWGKPQRRTGIEPTKPQLLMHWPASQSIEPHAHPWSKNGRAWWKTSEFGAANSVKTRMNTVVNALHHHGPSVVCLRQVSYHELSRVNQFLLCQQ